jgi:hypothetical protein
MALTELSFQMAKDISVQLITISSGIIGLSVTFMKEFKNEALAPLKWSLGFHLASILCGIAALQFLTGTVITLAKSGDAFEFPDKAAYSAMVQIALFLAGTAIFLFVAWRSKFPAS